MNRMESYLFFRDILKKVQNHDMNYNFHVHRTFYCLGNLYEIQMIYISGSTVSNGLIVRLSNVEDNNGLMGDKTDVFYISFYTSINFDVEKISTIRLFEDNDYIEFAKSGKPQFNMTNFMKRSEVDPVIIEYPFTEEQVFMKSTIMDVPEMDELNFLYEEANTFLNSNYCVVHIDFDSTRHLDSSTMFSTILDSNVDEMMYEIAEVQRKKHNSAIGLYKRI